MAFAPFIMPIMAGATAPLVASSKTYLQYFYSGDNVTSYTVNNVTLGAAAANRVILLMLATGEGASGSAPTSVTIGGIAATRDYNFTTSSANWMTWNAYSANVPTGTTGTVNITYATTNYKHPVFAAYALNNSTRVPAFNSAAAADVTGTVPVSVNLNVPAGGMVFAIARDSTSPTAGVTQDTTIQEYYRWAVGSSTPPAGSLTVSFDRWASGPSTASSMFAAVYV